MFWVNTGIYVSIAEVPEKGDYDSILVIGGGTVEGYRPIYFSCVGAVGIRHR